MHTEWDLAHTDYSAPPDRPLPAGLTDSEADWHQRLEQAPNGHLLREDANAMLASLTAGGPVYLLHLTRSLDAIRSSGHLLASTGCLIGAVYGSPLTPLPGGVLRPHNLGSYLLDARHGLASRRDSTPLVIQVTPGRPAPVKGLDYLRLGGIHLWTYQTYRHFLTAAEDDQVLRSVVDRVRVAAPFLDKLLHNASGGTTPNESFIDALAATVPVLPYLGYLYFETVAEYLMLHSSSRATREYADCGEMNNRLYKELAFSAVDSMGTLFDLGRFYPGHTRLLDLIGRIEPGLAASAADYVRRRMSHLFAATSLTPRQDIRNFTFHTAGLGTLAKTAPRLLGQLIFREIRLLDRYPQLYHCFEQAKALQAWAYWNKEGILTPFNGVSPKGEIGINPACPNARFTVWTAESCRQGLLHPVEQIAAVPAPRLVPWLVAPLRNRTEEERWSKRRAAPT
ncbi:hypothetical protein GCM10018790_30880 [Kitasatospora xanthocidica]|uniref:hypothetical protein n=1 Tax=Kitasatospora xanthocidica TaxID=83382 RepID=UPI001674876F|nr:hypothetical protein [Kitasatospora xanthocidica]GHF50902.1 hypothetical protein GCM10018790_30880 [Kitasatospora xanthocidica]